MKYKIIFILFILNNNAWASVDSFLKAYLYQEEGCQNVTTREDKIISLWMNNLVKTETGTLKPLVTTCRPDKINEYPFKDFLFNIMEGGLNISANEICKNVNLITSNGKFNLDWESQLNDLTSLDENKINKEVLKTKLNISNSSIALVKSCEWQWKPEQKHQENSTLQSCVIEMNEYFYHNKAEFISSYSPNIISQKIMECFERFPGKIIDNISIFISSDGSHSASSTLKDVNEQLTKDRLVKVKNQLVNILNSNEIRMYTSNEIKINSTLGWNDFGSSGPEKIISSSDQTIKEDLKKYRKIKITLFLKKRASSIPDQNLKGNLKLNCLSTIYSCSQTPNSLGQESSTIILNNDSTDSPVKDSNNSVKGT